MLKFKNAIFFITWVLLMSTLISCDASEQLFSQLTTYAEQAQKDWHVPGMAIAVVENGKIVYAKGFGERNAKGQPVTPNTIFDIASLTKSFTAALLAIQVDKGKYHWNTPVKSLDPAFQLYSPTATREFEVRDLIAHDSGLPPDALDVLGDFGYSAEDYMQAVRYVKPIAPFRSQFAYQDVFLEFAQKIIRQESGQSYAENLHDDLFSPLKMNRSYTRTEPILAKLTNVAQPFQYYNGKNYPYPNNSPYLIKRWALEPGVAGGGIHSTVVDLARWLIFNMDNGRVGNKELISKRNMDYLHSPQTIIKRSPAGQVLEAYGEGWFINKEEYKPYTVLYHPGGGTGMHALMAYIPEQKIGIVILTNQWGNKVPEAVYQRFFDLYLHRNPMPDWNAIDLKQQQASTEKGIESDPCQTTGAAEDLKPYVGNYYNPVYGILPITWHNGKLTLTIGPAKMVWELSYCRGNTLKAYWANPSHMPVPMLGAGNDMVEFIKGTHHQIDGMVIPYLNQDGTGVFFKK